MKSLGDLLADKSNRKEPDSELNRQARQLIPELEQELNLAQGSLRLLKITPEFVTLETNSAPLAQELYLSQVTLAESFKTRLGLLVAPKISLRIRSTQADDDK